MITITPKLYCHLCNHIIKSDLILAPLLKQVTSDCRPWKHPLRIVVCEQCGTVQKCTDPKSLEIMYKVYIDYKIYAQSNGSDQISFDFQGNPQPSRSESLVNLLESIGLIKSYGQLLDFGCGNGNFLRAFGSCFSSWNLIGADQNTKYEKEVINLPNTQFTSNAPDQINDQFNLISLIHVLEHIVYPIDFLKNISKKLKVDGFILIEIPNLEKSPFDILIADHVTHFNQKTLQQCLILAGLEIVYISDSVIDKEITVLAKVSTTSKYQPLINHCTESTQLLNQQINFASYLLQCSKQVSNDVGIFGSSIAASWLTGEINEKVGYFIEEDIKKIGNQHLGRPIITIDAVPHGSTIVLPFRADIAKLIIDKFNHLSKHIFLSG